MATSMQEAVVTNVIILASALFLAAGILRFSRVNPVWTGLLLPLAFLGAYWQVYSKIPPFSPVGAVNKVFYIVLVGAIIGLVLDLTRKPRLTRAVVLLHAGGSALYIGAPRFQDAPFAVLLAALCGILVQLVLSRGAGAPYSHVDRGLIVAIGALGFAPIALLGASSSSFQLCAAFAVATLGCLVWHLRNPKLLFDAAFLIGGSGGVLAVIYTVTLITKKTDLLALAVLGMILLAPAMCKHVVRRFAITNEIARHGILAALCLVPAGAGAVIVFLRYPSSFPS